MLQRLTKFIALPAWTLGLCLFLVACQDTIPERATITKNLSQTTGGTSGGSDGAPTRPTGAIFFKSDFCGCKDGKAVTYGNCATFCATKPNTNAQEVFYANFTVNEEISLNSGLGNVYNWCSLPLEGEQEVPKCALEYKEESGSVNSVDVTPIPNTNSITSIIDSLEEDKAYVLTLVETRSGARSNSIQIIKYSEDIALPVLGPLKNAPISQYSCIIRTYDIDESNSTYYYNYAYRIHFYFLPAMPPQPIVSSASDLICHDIFNPAYGPVDEPLFPRLELIPGVFNLWDTTDPRFYDNNSNGTKDVNEIITQKTNNFGGSVPAGINFFLEFKWPGSPQLSEEAGNNASTLPIGYYMAPWIDQSTFKSYCLTSTQYNSSNPLFKAMKDIIGVDTEGLYIGEKVPETVTINGVSTTGEKDYILIRETDLKDVWFYMKNGVPTIPTDAVVASVPVYFYYPLNKLSPFVKTSTQRIFQVKGAAELSSGSGISGGGSSSSGGTTSYPPHDRKIGCIPKF